MDLGMDEEVSLETHAALPEIRAVLRRAQFDDASIGALFGVQSMNELTAASTDYVIARTATPTPLHVLVRLFVLGMSCPEEVVRAALSPVPLDAWVACRLLRRSEGALRGTVALAPFEDHVIAFDRETTQRLPHHVMGPSESGRQLTSAMVQRRSAATLDLGAGCGLLALVAALDSERVVASDLNPRAASFVDFNAALNGIRNLRAVTGDGFEAVAGQRFDRIVCNPPFPILPSKQAMFLSDGRGDRLCARLARESGAYLEEGGTYQMFCSWMEFEGADWDREVRPWCEGNGCDAWLLRRSGATPTAYARRFLGPEVDLEPWAAELRAQGVTSIGTGLLLLRRRNAEAHRFWANDGLGNVVRGGGAALARRIELLDRVSACSDDALLALRLRLCPSARLTQSARPVDGSWSVDETHIHVSDGLCWSEEIDDWLTQFLGACDGARTLRSAIEFAAAALDLDASDAIESTLPAIPQFVEEGFLVAPA